MVDPATSGSTVIRGQENYLKVRVSNRGPAEARSVVVDARLAAYVGTRFEYDQDWTAIDATHIRPAGAPAHLGNIVAGGEAVATFPISAAQVDALWGWKTSFWSPCALAVVEADND